MPAFDIPSWQAVLDTNRDVFTDMSAGASVGLVDDDGLNAPPCPMLVWTWAPDQDRMVAVPARFKGFAEAGVDLLLVARNGAFEDLQRDLDVDALERLGEMVTAGAFVFYVFRTRNELQERGHEELLEILGLGFLGACR